MRLFLLIQNDPFFLPKDIDLIINNYNIIGVSILNSKNPNISFLNYLKNIVNIFGTLDLIKVLIKAFNNYFLKGNNLKSKFKKKNIKIYDTYNVNDLHFVKKISELDIDILISIACPQILKKNIINIPKVACINLHGGYLPNYAGLYSAFWNLHDNADFAGCTVHYISNKIDQGAVIDRKKIKISKDDTMFTLYEKISIQGIKLLRVSLNKILSGQVKKQNFKNYHYRSYPTKYDKLNFLNNKKKII